MKIHSDYREVEGHEEAHGAEMRVVIGPEENAPNFVMRVFELQPGAASPYHTHPWEHAQIAAAFAERDVEHARSIVRVHLRRFIDFQKRKNSHR